MNSLFEKPAYEEIKGRINKLTPKSERKWGKMDVAQMFAHVANAMEVAIEDRKLPRSFLGRIVGPFSKVMMHNNIPFPKNSPTDPNFKIVTEKDFNLEKLRLLDIIDRFYKKGISGITAHEHPFFGKLNREQWGLTSYKHLNHHLEQFGV